MSLGYDERVRDEAVRLVSFYINQDALALEELPAYLSKAIRDLRFAVERRLDGKDD